MDNRDSRDDQSFHCDEQRRARCDQFCFSGPVCPKTLLKIMLASTPNISRGQKCGPGVQKCVQKWVPGWKSGCPRSSRIKVQLYFDPGCPWEPKVGPKMRPGKPKVCPKVGPGMQKWQPQITKDQSTIVL
jgi:hypothetical protein